MIMNIKDIILSIKLENQTRASIDFRPLVNVHFLLQTHSENYIAECVIDYFCMNYTFRIR